MALLRHASRNATEGFRLFTATQALAYRLDALEWRAIAAERVSEDIIREVQAIREELTRMHKHLAHLGREEHQAWHVWERAQEYSKAMDVEYEAILAGDMARAKSVDKERVDPAFDRLDSAISVALSAYDRKRTWFNRLDDWGTSFILVLAGLIIAWMVEDIRRAQMLAERARADQRILEEARRAEAQIRKLNEDLEVRVQTRTAELQSANRQLREESTIILSSERDCRF